MIKEHKHEHFEYLRTNTSKSTKQAVKYFIEMTDRADLFKGEAGDIRSLKARSGRLTLATLGGLVGYVKKLKLSDKTIWFVVVGQVNDTWKNLPESNYQNKELKNVNPDLDFWQLLDNHHEEESNEQK